MEDYVFVNVDEEFRQLLRTIFTDAFMKQYTNFESFEFFQYSSAVITNWNTDQMVYSKLLMDNFVNESTEFTSWDEMVRAAVKERFGA